MKVGDLVRMKYEARQYDNHLRVSELKPGSLGVILAIFGTDYDVGSSTARGASLWADGRVWQLHLDYFERVDR
jgi:hypothetical protein